MLKKFGLIILTFSLNAAFAQDVSLDLQKQPRLTTAQRSALWAKVPAGAVVSFASSGVRYARETPPALDRSSTWSATGWKNEKVHTQLIVYSRQALDQVSLTVSDLKDDKGNTISKNAVTTGFVQYVMTDEFRDGCGYRKSTDFDSSWVADIINTDIRDVRVPANTTQPVWISVKIPADAVAGKYIGTIKVDAGKVHHLKVEINVVDKVLPAASDWTFRLDYWQHPAAIARVHNVPLWSDEHFDLMRKYYTLLASAGQKTITASIVDEPWNHQTYDDYPSLIRWTKKDSGAWEYDYSLFDKYIRFVMSCGITGRINCYSMVPWKIAFKYYDEALQKDTVFTGDIGTPAYNDFWFNMLTDFTKHLKQKGWFGMTAIAMDERPMEAMKSVIRVLKSVDSGWKISLAGDFHPEIEQDIDDYCVASRWTFPDDVLAKRKQQGKASTWYTCCTEKYPNEFTFSPPDEAVWMGWYTAATGMDGFLRWAYNSWTAHPLTDSRFTAWPAGDTYQVYPGPLSSIRFEKLIEGVQDFEKITLLKKLYVSEKNTTKLKELKDALATFKIPDLAKVSARQMIEKYQRLLNE